jgi:hypothetical protein
MSGRPAGTTEIAGNPHPAGCRPACDRCSQRCRRHELGEVEVAEEPLGEIITRYELALRSTPREGDDPGRRSRLEHVLPEPVEDALMQPTPGCQLRARVDRVEPERAIPVRVVRGGCHHQDQHGAGGGPGAARRGGPTRRGCRKAYLRTSNTVSEHLS